MNAFWRLVDWSDVANRFSSVRTLDLLLEFIHRIHAEAQALVEATFACFS